MLYYNVVLYYCNKWVSYNVVILLYNYGVVLYCCSKYGIYRVSRKKVYPFAANLVNIKYKDLAYLSYTIG